MRILDSTDTALCVQLLGLTPRVFHHLFARMEAAQAHAQVCPVCAAQCMSRLTCKAALALLCSLFQVPDTAGSTALDLCASRDRTLMDTADQHWLGQSILMFNSPVLGMHNAGIAKTASKQTMALHMLQH